MITGHLSARKESTLATFLRKKNHVFAWEPLDFTRIPRVMIEHHLAICPDSSRVKQKAHRQAQHQQDFISREVKKVKLANVVREVRGYAWT
jgi:hypothetical protein